MRVRSVVTASCLALAVSAGTTPAVAQTASAAITGTVTSAAGEPLDGVCVEVYGEQDFDEARTGPDGSYRVDGLMPGEHLVGFNTCAEPLAGFASEFFRDAVGFEDAEPVQLAAGDLRQGVDASLDRAAVLRGTVTDDDGGDGLAGICVAAFGNDTGSFGFTVTDDRGDWEVASLRGGDYLLSFDDCTDPFTYVSELYDDVPLDGEGNVEPTVVTVGDGETRSGLDAGLALGGSVTGSITGLHHGEPQSLVCVSADGVDNTTGGLVSSGFVPSPTFDAQPGRYIFGGLRPGSYDIVVNNELCGDDGYDVVPVEGPQQVRVGQVTDVGNIVLAPRPSISFACFDDEEAGPAFSDVRPSDVHGPAVDCAASYGIVQGPGDGTYRPAGPVRRDAMAAFVARTLEAGGTVLPTDPPDAFSDDTGNTHELAIDQLAALGIVQGKGDGRYGITEPVSRGQMATFLVNAYQEATGFTLRSAGDAFPDDSLDVHRERIDKAATAGLVAGSGGAYQPAGQVRRDQMATFASRLLDRVQRDLVATELEPFSTSSFGPTTVDGGPTSLPRRAPGLRTLLR